MPKLLLLLITGAIGFCGFVWTVLVPTQPPVTSAPLQGDAVRGEEIFKYGTGGAPPCSSCHALHAGLFGLGPVMIGIADRAGQCVSGLTADDYMRQSILEPGAFIVPGYRNIMYPSFADHLTEQDIADLIAYLKTL